MVVKLTFLPSPSLSPSASPATDPPLIISQTASSHPTLHFPPATTQKFALRFNITFKTQTRAADVYLRNETPQKINVPWGFTALLKCAKMVDPGLEWDVSQGWIQGRAISSVNAFAISKTLTQPKPEPLLENTLLCDTIPHKAAERKKYFLDAKNAEEFMFMPEYTYEFELSSNFLDIENMQLALPGFNVNLRRFWDGKSHASYVLINKATGERYWELQMLPVMTTEATSPTETVAGHLEADTVD